MIGCPLFVAWSMIEWLLARTYCWWCQDTHSTGLVAMNAVAALAATDTVAWSFVEALWEAAIPEGRFRYYDGMLYLLGLMHVTGNFRIWTDTQRHIPTPSAARDRTSESCYAALNSFCCGALQSSTGNCFICCGQHQQVLEAAHCAQLDFDRYCHQSSV